MLLHGLPILTLTLSIASAQPSPPWAQNGTFGHNTLDITRLHNGTALRVTVSNGPINLYDASLGTDMYTLLTSLDPSSIPSSLTPPKVIVFSSANPSFWIGHYDINLILPNGTSLSANETTALFEKNVAVARALGTLPTIFIAEINGRTTGSGGEFLLQCDMAFAGPDAVLGSMEGAVGGLQGNGGIQYLVRRVGMARAAEYLLQATSIGAQEAAEVGWVNRAFESEDRLREGVDEIVYRLSLLPAGGLNGTKSAIRANGPSVEQADADVATILRLFPDEIGYLPRLIELSENQTAGEFELGALRDIKDVERLHGVE